MKGWLPIFITAEDELRGFGLQIPAQNGAKRPMGGHVSLPVNLIYEPGTAGLFVNRELLIERLELTWVDLKAYLPEVNGSRSQNRCV